GLPRLPALGGRLLDRARTRARPRRLPGPARLLRRRVDRPALRPRGPARARRLGGAAARRALRRARPLVDRAAAHGSRGRRPAPRR
ncbi:MAG: hypothetical protein AVDCRST_MAG30-4367, partial [uncultured Solirubrobacteraceae bacterium]